MPLKEMKDPGETKKSPPKEPRAAPAPEADADPWKYLEDGTKVRKGRKLPYENQLKDLFDTISGAVTLADEFSGTVIGNQSQELAYGYAKLAKEDARVKAFFEKAFTASAYSAIVVPTVLTVVPIAWHFGLVPGKIGAPLALASGVMPVTRQQEREWRDQAAQEQAQAEQAEAAAARATHPKSEAPDGD